jgi:hypothetical protein
MTEKLNKEVKTYSVRVAQSFLKGRIDGVRRFTGAQGNVVLTLLILPAVDEYSSPAVVEVSSRQPIGKAGEEWEGYVQVGGYRNSWDRTDDKTGEIEKIRTAFVQLKVTE